MKLKCPACGRPISAGDINIQKMVALCPHCDNVFRFDKAFTTQLRKFRPPRQFKVIDCDPTFLNMSFKWSFRTEPPVSIFALIFAFVILLPTFLGMVAEGAPFAYAILPLIPLALVSYTALTLALNSTHYEADGETLTVYSEPLPYFRYGKKTVAVDEIRDVTVERPAYAPFPEGKAGFYYVYVHTLDRDKFHIAAYVNYEHAHFIAQEIKAYVQAQRESPQAFFSNLTERETEAEIAEDSAEANGLQARM